MNKLNDGEENVCETSNVSVIELYLLYISCVYTHNYISARRRIQLKKNMRWHRTTATRILHYSSETIARQQRKIAAHVP